MTYTAQQEHIGGSRSFSGFTTTTLLPAPSGPGCARLIVSNAAAGSPALRLPDATNLRAGSNPYYVIHSVSGAASTLLVDDAAATVSTMTAGNAYEVYLQAGGSAAGTWFTRARPSTNSPGLSTLRQPLHYLFQSYLIDWNLYDHALLFGWDGVSPVALVVEIDTAAVVGSTSGTSGPSLVIAGFPTGSTLLLIVKTDATIAGPGGAGGRGGDSPPGLLALVGGPGGLGLRTSINWALVNHGYIQGGGGGGGGGSNVATVQAGGGGGGGAGQNSSTPGGGGNGAPQPNPTPNGNPGNNGTLYVAGGGGQGGTNGGTGGAPGVAGDSSGAAGGAAGVAIEYALSPMTYNPIRLGTVYGAVVGV